MSSAWYTELNQPTPSPYDICCKGSTGCPWPFGPKTVEGGRESTQKETMERKSAPVGEAGESSEGRGRPKPGPVGDVRLCRQLWLGAVRPSKVSFVHPRVKGTFIPNEFGGSHFRSLPCLPKRPCPIRANQIKPEMGPSSGIRAPSF